MIFFKETDFQETPIGRIPKDWDIAKLEDICEKVRAGGTPLTSKKEYWNGGLPFVKIEDITLAGKYLTATKSSISKEGLSSSSAWLVPENSLLFAMYGSMGEVSINKIPVTTNQAILGIIPQDRDDVEFLYYWFSFFKPRWKKYAKPTTQANLTAEILRNMIIPLPSQKERRAITEVLGVVDSVIAKTGEVIAKTERLKKGLMQTLLTRGIGHTEYKQTPIGKIPKEWKFGKLVDFSKTKDSSVKTGPFGAQLHASDYAEDGVPLILIKNVLDGQIVDYNMPRVAETKASELTRYRLKEGDIVFSRVGSVGRAAVIRKHQESWLVSGQMLRVRLENPEIDNEFLSYAIATNWFQKALASRTVGATRKSINTEILSNLPMVVPNLSEQRRIANILLDIDKKLEFERKEKAMLEKIKRGLMDLLLTGKIRIKVD